MTIDDIELPILMILCPATLLWELRVWGMGGLELLGQAEVNSGRALKYKVFNEEFK